MISSVRHESRDHGVPLEPGGLERSVMALVSAAEWVPGPDATVKGTAERGGEIGLAGSSLRLSHCRAELEFKNVQGYTVRGFYPGAASERPYGDESALLVVTTSFIRGQQLPMIVIWGKNYFDIAHLRHREFSQGAIAEWLLPTVVGGIDCLRTAKHFDLWRFLYPEGLTIPFEEALDSTGVMPKANCSGLEKLEILAAGLPYFVARAFCYTEILTRSQDIKYLNSYFDNVAEIAKKRNHLAILAKSFVGIRRARWHV